MQRAPISSQIAALRLPGLGPRDLAAAADLDAESPVDVRGLPPSTPLTPDTGVRSKLELPAVGTPGCAGNLSVSQNEIKKAQNRKSAKRFREAQKRRWQSLQEQLKQQMRTIDDLRSALNSRGAKRSMSINALIGNAEPDNECDGAKREEDALTEAEAALYAQLLSSTAPVPESSGCSRPYVAELGTFERCMCISEKGIVLNCRRGAPLEVGQSILQGVPEADAVAVRRALMCGNAVAVGYVRDEQRFNAVIKPVVECTNLLIAEFIPFGENRTRKDL